MSQPVHIFAGPTLFGTPFHADAAQRVPGAEIQWRPPARRGDIEALIAECREPGVLALADGTFHAYPSVRHIELRDALEAGWTVYGLCSMGAIRACEMAHMGMKPWGRVAQMFCADPDLADDEVALVHGAEHPFLPISEPMLHIREYLAQMIARGLLTLAQLDAVASSLRERWYGYRTLSNLRVELRAHADVSVHPQLEQALADFTPYRLKQQDLITFVATRPWLRSLAPARLTA